MTRWQGFLSGAACGALVLVGFSARAAAPVRLSYQAPQGCAAEGFVAAVRARGASLEAGAAATAASSEGVRWLKVTIEQDAAGFSGALQVRDGEQTSERREVHALSCAEVSDGLAVVAAIALAADAPAASSVPAASAPAASAPAAAAPPHVAAAAAAVAPAAAPATRERDVHVVRLSDSVDVPAGKLGFEYLRGYHLSAGVALGVIPNLTLPRIDFALSSSSLVKTPGDADYLIGAGLRVRWSFLGVATHRSAGFSTRIWGLKAGLGNCGPLIYNPRGLILSLCSEIAAGAISLETRDATGTSTQSKAVGVGTAGIELVSQYNLGSLLHVDLRAGGEMWLSKLTVERPDGGRLFRSSTFNAYVLAGLGLQF